MWTKHSPTKGGIYQYRNGSVQVTVEIFEHCGRLYTLPEFEFTNFDGEWLISKE